MAPSSDMLTDAVPQLSGYVINEKLYEGSRTAVYRAVSAAQQAVVIKVMQQSYPDFGELVHFRNQYTITKDLAIANVVHPLSLEPWQNGYALVMEDFGGISLQTYTKERQRQNDPLALIETLAIAIQITDILHSLCQHQIVHKDIKPANLLIHPVSKQVKLIDFSIASLLPKEIQATQNPNGLEGTLAYIAPEQTGRMNRGIDYRTDFYSFGITLYELLTGELPFSATEPLELVHCHIAKTPTAPHQINEKIPAVVSKIVLKLMAKNAEDRYQSALGIKHDLEKCLAQWKETGLFDDFALGQRDVCDRFLISEKLYGREHQVQSLLEAFDRVSQGSSEMMLVAGFSGIGKTAVINEVHKPITRQHGYFIKGKFDQFNRNIPFSAFVQAFRSLMGQLLSESDAALESWKTKILEALKEDGQVITTVLPELENIIGKQPAAPELSGSAAQSRFNLRFQKFVQVFTTPEHPLTLFLDDLQWADSASLNLLSRLLETSESEVGYLLILGAYRDNEVSPAHPLMQTLGEIKQQDVTINTLTLKPLSQPEITTLTAESLLCSDRIAMPLAQLVYRKTRGNPFFTTQFLQGLYKEDCIEFSVETGQWQCDLAQVKQLALTDDVVEFMLGRLQKLSEGTQRALKFAACLGNCFDLKMLVVACHQTQAVVAQNLWEALQEGLIIPENETYKFFHGENQPVGATSNAENGSSENSGSDIRYRFLHDRVQQAAYTLIPEDQKPAAHYRIGQHLLKNLSETEQQDSLFALVNHLNFGQHLITDRNEQKTLARFNLQAGEKALASVAYTAAIDYLETGVKLLILNDWDSQYSLCFNLYRNLCVAYLNNAAYKKLEQTIPTVLRNISAPIDRVEFYIINITKLSFQGDYEKAIEVGLSGLRELNIEIDNENLPEQASAEFSIVEKHMESRSIRSLLDLSTDVSPNVQATIKLLIILEPPVYLLGNIDLYSLICLRATALSIEHGNVAESIKAYANYGLLLNLMKEQYQRGYEFARLALDLSYKLNSKAQQCKAGLLLGSWLQVWAKPIAGAAKINYDSFIAGVEAGETLFSGYNLYGNIFNRLFHAEHLSSLSEDIDKYWLVAEKSKDALLSSSLAGARIFVKNLCRSRYDQREDHSLAEAEKIICKSEKARVVFSVCLYHILNIQLSYLLEDFEESLNALEKAGAILSAVAGFTTSSGYYYYGALVLLQQYSSLSAEAQLEAWAQIEANQAKLKSWAQSCPENFLHKALLVEAECCRCLNHKLKAVDLYDQAIASARDNGYIQEGALANELAAKFYLAWNKEAIAADYLQKAYFGYARWGAQAKTEQLEKGYAHLLSPILEKPAQSSLNPFETQGTILASSFPMHSSTQSSGSTTGANTFLDFTAILKASQILSRSIEINELLHQLTALILQNSGGDRCALLLPDLSGVWEVQAIATTDAIDICAEPLEGNPNLPVRLIQYVKNKQEAVIIDNLQTDLPVIGDYLSRQQPKSVLCLPLLNQGNMIGILYLKNQSTSGVFTKHRLTILNFLCGQAAISLENARLYQQSQTYAQQLEESQLKTVQSEKMASLGNLVAGVAHEINNPIGFLNGSIKNAHNYVEDLQGQLTLYQQHYPNPVEPVQENAEEIDLDFVCEDLPKLLSSMKGATDRIKAISTSLRTFSRADTEYKVSANLHEGLDSTLLILKYRLKANENRPAIEIIKDYGDLPVIDCFPGRLNQVFMNLLANAIDVFDEAAQQSTFAELKDKPQIITVKTAAFHDKKAVEIRIGDNGKGMSAEVKERIFDHLFTTKGVGKGTGLGLAIAQQIIVEAHGGTLNVRSESGQGSEFCIHLPF
ncbi:MAG: AAA family ATPase [Phormidesmis sp.]